MPDLRRHRLGARHQVVGRAIATLSADGRFRDVVCHPKDGRVMCLTGFMARVTMIRSRIAERYPGLPVSGLLRVAYLLHAVNRPAVASGRLTVRVGHALDGPPVGRSRRTVSRLTFR
jgi:hypothetical protein